ncbi:MAG: hypothetical protein ACREU3_03595 [Steroidobacteraceae bacterium]
MKWLSWILGCCVALVGCVQTSEVIPTGKHTYYVHVVGNIGYDPDARALQKADQYCLSHGLVATITHLEHTEWPRITASVQFRCPDKRHQKSAVLGADPGPVN